jgi:hypothetical protein
MATGLFWAGLISSGIIGFMSLTKPGQDKAGMVALPFMLFLASAVAHYIGM